MSGFDALESLINRARELQDGPGPYVIHLSADETEMVKEFMATRCVYIDNKPPSRPKNLPASLEWIGTLEGVHLVTGEGES